MLPYVKGLTDQRWYQLQFQWINRQVKSLWSHRSPGFPICASESPFRTHPKSLDWSRVTRISNPYHQQPLVTPNARLRNYPIIPIDGFALMEAVCRTLTVSPVIAIFLAPDFSLTSTDIIGRTSNISSLIVIVMRDFVTVVFPCVEYNRNWPKTNFVQTWVNLRCLF